MTWPFEIAERDHDLQNPTSPEKIRLLGESARLTSDSRVLDVACGKGGPATLLAAAFGCRVVGVELRPAFADAARERVAAAGLEALVEIRTGDAAVYRPEPESFDAALCLGASFVWGTIADAAVALVPVVRRGGYVAIGEPYWREWPLPAAVDAEDFVDLERTGARFESAGLAITGLVAASEGDWDRYESLHWRAIEEWLAEEPEDADAAAVAEQHRAFRSEYLRTKRSLLGWAIFVGRKP